MFIYIWRTIVNSRGDNRRHPTIRIHLILASLAVILLITACPPIEPPPTPNPTLQISVTPTEIDPTELFSVEWEVLNVPSGQLCQLFVDRTDAGGETFLPELVSDVDCTGTTEHAPGTFGGHRYIIFLTTGGKEYQENSDEVFRKPISSTTTEGYSDNQVPQNAGTIRITIEGIDLNNPTNPKLIEANLNGTIITPDSTPSSVVMTFDIPHGIPPGPQQLQFNTSNHGTIIINEAITLTPIIVAPNGSPSGNGSFTSPFDLPSGLAAAGAEDTVHLLDGQHVLSAGFVIPDGIILEGQSTGAIIKPFDITANDYRIEFEGKADVRTLTIDGIYGGFYTDATDNVTIDGVVVTRTGIQGLYMEGDSTVLVTNSVFTGNQLEAFHIHGNANVTIRDTESSDNAAAGIKIHDACGENDYKIVNLERMTIRNNQNSGIYMITCSNNGEARVRDTIIEQNQFHGIHLQFNLSTIDFGTLDDPGGNTLRDNGQSTARTYWELYDERPERTIADGVLLNFVGNSIEGEAFDGAGVKTGSDEFSLAGVNYWRIENTNNKIRFSSTTTSNLPPTASPMSDISVPEGAADQNIDLTDFFDDEEDGAAALLYTASSESETVSAPTVAGTMLTLSFGTPGSTPINVSGTDSGGRGASTTFTVSVTAAGSSGPSNDDFASASMISGASGSTNGINVDASDEVGESTCLTRSRSVWWTWTAPQSAGVIFSTEGSTFDTVLEIYTGSSVDGLTCVSSNDDAVGLQSVAAFDTVVGTTYHVAVSGYGSSGTHTGSISLSWNYPDGLTGANIFASTCASCHDAGGPSFVNMDRLDPSWTGSGGDLADHIRHILVSGCMSSQWNAGGHNDTSHVDLLINYLFASDRFNGSGAPLCDSPFQP